MTNVECSNDETNATTPGCASGAPSSFGHSSFEHSSLIRHSNLTPTFPGVPGSFGKVTDPSDNSQLTPLPGSRAVSDNSGQFAINLAEKQQTPNLGPEFASERQSLNEAGEALAQPVVGKSDVSLGGTAATPKQTPGEAGIGVSTLPVLLQWHYVPPKIPETGMVDIIYARKSSDKQREDSIADQDRRARVLLAQQGFDPASFFLFADSDESGLLDNRPEIDRIHELIRQKRVRTLAVIHQDRFSRGVNVLATITDLVFLKGRFLSLEEHIDTNVEGWEFQVGVRAAMNHEFTKNLRRRSREGTIGRLHDGNGSAGDFPYGYTSVPIEAANPKRNRRPKTKVIIDVLAAALIVMIFVLFAVQNYTVAAICRWIDEHRAEYPMLPCKGPMYAAYVRAILRNTKYIGQWWYGATRAVRNSKGEKRFEKVNTEDIQRFERPDLRIVSQDLWERAQTKLAKLKEIHGLREGHRKRGPREYYRLMYAKKLLPGLTFCSVCGSSMLEYSSKDKRLNCKGHRQRICANNVTLPCARAEAAVLRELEKLLKAQAAWTSSVVIKTKEKIRQKQADSGLNRDQAEKALRSTRNRLQNIADMIEQNGGSPTLQGRLNQLERQQQMEQQVLDDLTNLEQIERRLPDEKWFANEMSNLSSLLQGEMSMVAHKLRPLIKKIVAEPVHLKHGKRGCYRVHISFDISAGLMPEIKAQFPHIVADAVAGSMPTETTVVVDLFDPHGRNDQKLEHAFAMRRQGGHWTDIAKATGIRVSVLKYYWDKLPPTTAA